MVSELVEFKGHLGKTQVPHRVDETLDESLYRGDNPHLTSRFCKDELGPKFQQKPQYNICHRKVEIKHANCHITQFMMLSR